MDRSLTDADQVSSTFSHTLPHCHKRMDRNVSSHFTRPRSTPIRWLVLCTSMFFSGEMEVVGREMEEAANTRRAGWGGGFSTGNQPTWVFGVPASFSPPPPPHCTPTFPRHTLTHLPAKLPATLPPSTPKHQNPTPFHETSSTPSPPSPPPPP